MANFITENSDRNFDPIADHFAHKVYGGLKGEIRLAVLRRDLAHIEGSLVAELNRPLKVLDVGAGLAQLSIELASRGHEVTVNDISSEMLKSAQQEAKDKGVFDAIEWHVCPYQELDEHLGGEKFDLVLCHALLEWLASPAEIFSYFKQWLAPHGRLSLCFYNPASFVYRNLIMGNFYLLDRLQVSDAMRQGHIDFASQQNKSLTPNHPVPYADVERWLTESGFDIESVSGLRVFHDYATHKRGGHQSEADLIRMEVQYSNQEPFKWLGRYLHVVARKNQFFEG